MDDIKLSIGERITLAAKLAATLHLLEEVKDERTRRQFDVGGADADRFTDGASSRAAGRTPGAIPGRLTF